MQKELNIPWGSIIASVAAFGLLKVGNGIMSFLSKIPGIGDFVGVVTTPIRVICLAVIIITILRVVVRIFKRIRDSLHDRKVKKSVETMQNEAVATARASGSAEEMMSTAKQAEAMRRIDRF